MSARPTSAPGPAPPAPPAPGAALAAPKPVPRETERRFEAIVVRLAVSTTMPDHDDAQLRQRLRAAVAHGIDVGLVVSPEQAAALARGLPRPAPGPGAVALAVASDPGVDALTRLLGWLSARGVDSSQVLVVGEPADTTVLEALLADQIDRRRRAELPLTVEDPAWSLVIDDRENPLSEGTRASLLALCDGVLGNPGDAAAGREGDRRGVLMAGVYTRSGAATHLLVGPRWHRLPLDHGPPALSRRVLDLRRGTLHEEIDHPDGRVQAMMLSSLARPGTGVMRARGGMLRARAAAALRPPSPRSSAAAGVEEGTAWMLVRGDPGAIAAAVHDEPHAAGAARGLDRFAAYEGARGPNPAAPDPARVRDRVRGARRRGFDALLAEHRQRWAERWALADIVIEGDLELQRAVRFCLFALIGAVGDGGEAAVGARGLTGPAYRGHVFWDSDVFVLPFLAATHPPAARAMLEYRVRRLPGALANARREGRGGARFPWESAGSGHDVTPTSARSSDGRRVAILTGSQEEHIVADVAWAVACYLDWTGDAAFAAGDGRELLVQTARWWASRIERDPDGRAHLRGVIGPDEYHENVDDNAFTNIMARWNLRRAAADGAGAADDAERRHWNVLADALVDGYDSQTGVYEQFAGFHGLEPLIIAQHAPRRPVAADILLGPDRVQGAQVVKQADVLMAHYLVPGEVAPGSLVANLDFYEPRTAHGSTLSPGVHAALLARAGRPEAAADLLRLTAHIDLDNIGDTTAGGLHMAAMGSVWRALAAGFAGLQAAGPALRVSPILPDGWQAFSIRVGYRGRRIELRVTADGARITADGPLTVLAADGTPVTASTSPQHLALRHREEAVP